MGDWLSRKERGSSHLLRFMIWLCQQRFRWLVNLLIYPIAGYFFIIDQSSRRASQEYFRRVKDDYRFTDYYRQLLCFSFSLVDRVTITQGESERFKVHSQGREHLHAELDKDKGFILLGSHLGSFEASKLLARERIGMDVHIVAHFAVSIKFNQALSAINPALAPKFIDPMTPNAIFQMRDVIDKGGVLAILADRTGIGDKQMPVNFLGKPATFPTGPYYLASILHCPILCFFGLRVGQYSYDTYAIKLADRIQLPRGRRDELAQVYAQKYADILAEKARQYPYNWFNFYKFWDSPKKS
ncbi:MAG: hypothetical protein V3W04_12035 [Gammaproteobacteria bacterium]